MRTHNLTPTEIACLLLAGAGYTDEEAAERLEISANSARYHIRMAGIRLGARNKTHCVVLALKQRIINLKEIPD